MAFDAKLLVSNTGGGSVTVYARDDDGKQHHVDVSQNATNEMNFRIEAGDLPGDHEQPVWGVFEGKEFDRINVKYKAPYLAQVTVWSDNKGYHLRQLV